MLIAFFFERRGIQSSASEELDKEGISGCSDWRCRLEAGRRGRRIRRRIRFLLARYRRRCLPDKCTFRWKCRLAEKIRLGRRPSGSCTNSPSSRQDSANEMQRLDLFIQKLFSISLCPGSHLLLVEEGNLDFWSWSRRRASLPSLCVVL